MTSVSTKVVRPTCWAVAVCIFMIAAAGCGNGNKSEVPAEFTPKPTTPPTGGLPKKEGAKQRGPADKVSDV